MSRTGGTIFVPGEAADEQEIEIADGVSHRFAFVSVDSDRVMIQNEQNEIVWRSDHPDVISFARAIADHVRGAPL
jgi:hypothetical protein